MSVWPKKVFPDTGAKTVKIQLVFWCFANKILSMSFVYVTESLTLQLLDHSFLKPAAIPKQADNLFRV
jgi:hypothetical protein